jgi:hypothetical protein
MAKKTKKRTFNEANVQREMAKELDVDPDDLVIDEAHIASFGEEAYTVSTGRKEWTIVKNDDAAERLAIAAVTQDLEHEPEIFNRDFIERHIDEEALKKWVWQAAMEDDYASEIARHDTERFWEEADRWGVEKLPEPDEDGNMPDDVDNKYIEALREKIADDKAESPMAFFEDIYGRDEAAKYAIEAVGIDVDAAAQDAVNTDGWQHFLARYDGNSSETASGFVYWRDN